MTTPQIGDDVWLWESATPEAAKIVAEAYPTGYHVVAWAFDGNTIFRAALPLLDATTPVTDDVFITVKGVRPNWNTSPESIAEAASLTETVQTPATEATTEPSPQSTETTTEASQ